MATQPETTETPAAEVAPPKKKGSIAALLPALVAVIAAPVLTWAVAVFVLIPQLKKELGSVAAPVAGAPAAEPAAAHGEAPAKGGKAGKEGGGATSAGFTFENIVVNLAGSMGTRYLKTTFLVTGTDAAIKTIFEEKKAALVDVTINVLSSLSLADLEEAGSKNIIREKLIQSYNQTLGRKVAEQIFFSDFVVQ